MGSLPLGRNSLTYKYIGNTKVTNNINKYPCKEGVINGF